MPTVRTNGIDVYYEDTGGEGAPVVLIHGHSVDLRMWPSQTLALREAGFRVIRYDVRGHGRSDAPDEGYSWTVYADDLLGLLDTLDVPAVHLAGLSMGGGIALQFALDHPGRVRSLTLIDAAVPGYVYSDDFSERVEELVTAVRAEGWRKAAERLWLTHPMFAGLRRHPAAFEIVRDIVLRYPARDYLIDLPEPEAPEAVERLAELRPPTLVVVGSEDLDDFLLAAQVVAANAPRVRLEVVESAGHMLPLERPGELNRLLIEFLADPDAAVAPAGPELEIRAARPGEIAAVAAIAATSSTRRALRLERRGLAPELTFDFTITEGNAEGMRTIPFPPEFEDEPVGGVRAVLVATLDGVIVGATAVETEARRGALWLRDIRVEEAVRGNGVGRALLEAADLYAHDRGLAMLRAEVGNDDLDAVAFFLHCGFRFSGFDEGYGRTDAGPAHITLSFKRELAPNRERAP